MDAMIGDWEFMSRKNFINLLEKMNVDVLMCDLALKFEKNDKDWTMEMTSAEEKSSIKITHINFKLDEEFDEDTVDYGLVKVSRIIDI